MQMPVSWMPSTTGASGEGWARDRDERGGGGNGRLIPSTAVHQRKNGETIHLQTDALGTGEAETWRRGQPRSPPAPTTCKLEAVAPEK